MRHYDREENDDDVIVEETPSLIDPLEIIRKLNRFVSSRQPELYRLVSALKFKLVDTY